MKATTIVLGVLCVIATLSIAAPVMAEGGDQEEQGDSCVAIYLKPPGASIDPRCADEVIEWITSLIQPGE